MDTKEKLLPLMLMTVLPLNGLLDLRGPKLQNLLGQTRITSEASKHSPAHPTNVKAKQVTVKLSKIQRLNNASVQRNDTQSPIESITRPSGEFPTDTTSEKEIGSEARAARTENEPSEPLQNSGHPARTYHQDASQYDNLDIVEMLANMNQKLQKLDKLDEMNSSLAGKINDVQSKVGEVSNQVSTVKADINRCEERWEEGTSAMRGRIEKVEQGFQAFEQKWEAGNSDLLSKILSVQSSVQNNSLRVTKLEEELKGYKEKWDSLSSLESQIKVANNEKFKELQDTITVQVHKDLSKEMKAAQSVAEKEIRYGRLNGEAFNKRHNLVVFGLPECQSPDEDCKAVTTFFSARMGLPKIHIEVAYRIGTEGARPRPLVVRFTDIKDRWAVWNKKSNMKYVKDVPVWLQEDLPKRLREDYRVLQRVAKVARSCPEKYSDIKVKDYKISINGTKYDRDHLHLLPSELSLAMVYTPCSEQACVFFTNHSPFSNHFSSDFTIEEIHFSCIEQYLAVQKAHMADDKTLAKEAMDSSDPADHKVVLNKLRTVVAEKWTEKAPSFIKAAAKAKFSQNHHLTKFLLDSHPLRIGEASRDTFWGIGLSLENPDVLDTTKWAPGGNLLGKTLMAVREDLMKMANFPAN